jgi:class 3 adenylate cyclase
LERVVRDPDSVVFLTRRLREVSLQATVSLSTNSLGACFVEEGADGGPVLLYTLGEQTLTGGAGLVGQYLKLVATLTRQHLLTLRRARMSKYFSPKVVEMLMHGGGAAAAQGGPSVVPATSLFFDLRGFSLSVETSASDLLDLQQDLTTIITLVTQTVFDAGGTVIDYQGDAVFAAWGVPFAQADQAELAARCALKILHRLEEADVAMARNQHQARETLCGIGLCMGEVLAGTVGSREMFKYGLLGPSVNVAKRLDSVTKPAYLHATVLCCEGLAQQLASSSLRLRRVARVRLGGMTRVENVYELIDPGAAHERTWQREHDERWNTVLTAVENARTEADLDALEPVLEQLPENHPRTVWLRQMALRLRDPSARAKWNGIINQ